MSVSVVPSGAAIKEAQGIPKEEVSHKEIAPNSNEVPKTIYNSNKTNFACLRTDKANIFLPTSDVFTDLSQVDQQSAVSQTLGRLEQAIESQNQGKYDALFLHDAFFRDQIAITGDFRTFHGLKKISPLLARFKKVGARNFKPADQLSRQTPIPGCAWLQATFRFETDTATCNGLIRLVEKKETKEIKIYNIGFGQVDLKEYPERINARRPVGATHRPQFNRVLWSQERKNSLDCLDAQPDVVIIGGGHNSLTLCARFKMRGIKALIVEKNQRIGDNWRLRYEFLSTHDDVLVETLPYMPFPSCWPHQTPAGKLGDFLEAYASMLELDCWTNSTLQSAKFDKERGQWTLEILRDGKEQRTLKPVHLVFGIGINGGLPSIPNYENLDSFQGKFMHSSGYRSRDYEGAKTAIVIGTGSSGHDIAQDLAENGIATTMIQRSPTYVMSIDKGVPVLFSSVFNEETPVEYGDAQYFYTPFALGHVLGRFGTQYITQIDKELIEGLERAGFKLWYGNEGAGFADLGFDRVGGYYFNSGCSDLIIDGTIKLRSGHGVKGFTESGIVLENGETLDADLVVSATGYSTTRAAIRKIIGDEVADQVGEPYVVDEEGEMGYTWRPSGYPNFWFTTGGLAHGRGQSNALSMQIIAQLKGFYDRYEG